MRTALFALAAAAALTFVPGRAQACGAKGHAAGHGCGCAGMHKGDAEAKADKAKAEPTTADAAKAKPACGCAAGMCPEAAAPEKAEAKPQHGA